MDATQKGEVIDVEKELVQDIPDDVVCIYPDGEKNAVTVRLDDYRTLEEICI
jgi:hypothetical protein